MQLIDSKTERKIDCKIEGVEHEDFASIKKYFSFDWKKEDSQYEVYKLIASGEIQGLISLFPMNDFLFLTLIELASFNIGKSKRYSRVAATLIAFAASSALESKDGYMAIDSKTALIEHYSDAYGFVQIGSSNRMISSPANSQKLVSLYL